MANNLQHSSSSSKRKASSSALNQSGGPTGDEWAKRLKEVDLSKSDLNRLVLDYLIVEGYQTAAEEFVRESGVLDASASKDTGGDDSMDVGEAGGKKSSSDLEGIQERMAIRKAVESGSVEEAIRRVNELDSDILDLHPHLIFHLHLLHLYELLLSNPSQSTPSSSSTSSNPTTTNLSSTLLFASETLAPLALSSPTHLAELEDALSLLLVLPNSTTNSTAEGVVGGGGGLSKQQRREKVAKELNAAILEGQGRGCESKLVGVWRCLKWGEGELIGGRK